MLKQLKKRESGFTIIEVLIVLAIAGLILLIVFLAVPALQRNSRNTQRRNDVSTYLAAVNEWQQNNQGNIPTAAADLTAANVGVNALAKSGFLTEPTAVVTGAQGAAVALGNMQYVASAVCDTGTIGDTVAGTNRQYAVRFSVESANNTAIEQCQDS